MLACHYHSHGAINKETTFVGNVSKPNDPGENQLLVKVFAASLNPADYKSANGGQQGLLAFNWPRIFGFDFSGTIEKCGVSTEDSNEQIEFNEGDRVFGMIRGLPQLHTGTLAEYILVDRDICAHCPNDLTHQECAAVPLVSITVVKAFEACGLKPKEELIDGYTPRVFITGGPGGVGSMAIQIAREIYGASFIATTASESKINFCTNLGAHQVINYKINDFSKDLVSDDDNLLFDAILDCTGEASKCVNLLRKGGGLCSILSGPTGKALKIWLNESKLSSGVVTTGIGPFLKSGIGGSLVSFFSGGCTLESSCQKRGGHFSHVIGVGNGEIMRKISKLMKDKCIKAIIDKEFSLKDSVDALQYLKAGKATGKIIINIVDRV
jgi:NADPH:quinone reductase-like Zn-dependent oxidoreductase